MALFTGNIRKMLAEIAKPSPDWEKVKSLSTGRYDFSGKNSRDGRALILALVEGACSEAIDQKILVSILRNIASRGGDLNKPIAEGGETPIHLVVKSCTPEVVSIFLEAGASPEATSLSGDSPLHVSTREGREDICRVLLAAGADAGAENSEGDAPIHIAVRGKNRKTMLRTLLRNGARAYHRNGSGHTPIRVAEKAGNHQYVPILEEALKSLRRSRGDGWRCPSCSWPMKRPEASRVSWYNTIGMWEHLRFTCGKCGASTAPTYLDGELS